MKKLIITLDTEGDNLWSWKPGDAISTENTLYLQRFQNLCEQYGFKPTWLTNYEMISDTRYVDFITAVEDKKTGELGMHLHAWNNPPAYDLPVCNSGAPYLIEYPCDIMEEKIATLTEEIIAKTGIKPVSHRAGRWAMNQKYFELLDKYGYTVDCSVTPNINWSSSVGQSLDSKGSDYSSYPNKPYVVEGTSVLEVPVSIVNSHRIFVGDSFKSFLKGWYHAIKGQYIWLRPTGRNLREMIYLSDRIKASDNDYAMFMIHSSELMPGGSPTFKSIQDIEKLYDDLDSLFCHLANDYEGISLRDYQKERIAGQ